MNIQSAYETAPRPMAPHPAMKLFKKAENTVAYLKMGIFGDAGSGKTFTASHVAKGLAQHIKAGGGPIPPVMFIDTETGSNFVKPTFDEAGIEFFTVQTRSFADLKMAVAEAEQFGAILIVDSITHFWQEVQESYLKAKQERTRRIYAKLEFQDYATLKPLWGEFTTAYLNSKAHIILCGRAGGTFEYQENEDTHKKDLIQTGTKMRAEKDMGYEPNLLVEMVIEKDPGDARKKKTVRKAFVIKDRWDILDGMEFVNPTFKTFAPHIVKLNLGGKHSGFDSSRTSSALFPKDDRDDRSLQRKIVLDEIESILVCHFPSTGGNDRKAKVEHLRDCLQASWTEMEKVMPLEDLRAGYDKLHRKLEGSPSRYADETGAVVNDEIPEFGSNPNQTSSLEALRALNGEHPNEFGSGSVRDDGAIFAAEQLAAKNFSKGETRIPAEYKGTPLFDAYCTGWEKAKAAAAQCPNAPTAPASCAPSRPEPGPSADNVPPRTAGGSTLNKAYDDGRADHAKRVGGRAVPAKYKSNTDTASAWRKGWTDADEEARQSEAEASQDREAV